MEARLSLSKHITVKMPTRKYSEHLPNIFTAVTFEFNNVRNRSFPPLPDHIRKQKMDERSKYSRIYQLFFYSFLAEPRFTDFRSVTIPPLSIIPFLHPSGVLSTCRCILFPRSSEVSGTNKKYCLERRGSKGEHKSCCRRYTYSASSTSTFHLLPPFGPLLE